MTTSDTRSMGRYAYAPTRERVHKERFASRAEAEAAFERMADTIRRSGLR
jgi:hypothetical protein